MAIFTISYDLVNNSGKADYKPLLQELQKQKCLRVQNTVWLGAFANSATQIHNHFKPLLEQGDRLFVTELVQHYAFSGFPEAAAKWLELNPPATLEKPQGAEQTAKPDAAEKAPAAKKTPAKKAPAKKAPAKKAPAKAK